jgi:hypothetical protein
MSQEQQQHYPSSFHGSSRGGGRGNFRGNSNRGFRGGSRGNNRGGARGGRGGFHQHNTAPAKNHADVDYTPEAIEARFSAFYLPSMTQDPWSHLQPSK